jgi:hypothetical protein
MHFHAHCWHLFLQMCSLHIILDKTLLPLWDHPCRFNDIGWVLRLRADRGGAEVKGLYYTILVAMQELRGHCKHISV